MPGFKRFYARKRCFNLNGHVRAVKARHDNVNFADVFHPTASIYWNNFFYPSGFKQVF